MPLDRRTHRIIGVASLLVAAVCALAVWRDGWPAHRDGASQPTAEPVVAVTVARAARRDAPVLVDSVATVQAYNSALLRARVDGEISKVTFVEGGQVHRGDVLFELDRRPFEAQVHAAEAQKASDDAKLANAALDLVRYEDLVTRDAATRQQLDATRSLVAQLRAGVRSDEAQLDAARLQLGYATIRAPFDGTTGARLLDVGNMVRASDANGLVTLAQIRPIGLVFALPQSLLPTLRAQQARGPLTVDALAEDGRTVLDAGRLTLIDNQVDAATGTIRCKATFDNAREQLWPGSFVTARVHLEVLPQAVIVPAAAIQPGSDGPFVWIVDAQDRARVRAVRSGATTDGQTVILDGLSGGEAVVVEGQFQLEAGTRVQRRSGG